MVASLTSLRFSIVSGGLACVAGTVAILAALPGLVGYDADATGLRPGRTEGAPPG